MQNFLEKNGTLQAKIPYFCLFFFGGEGVDILDQEWGWGVNISHQKFFLDGGGANFFKKK